MTQHDSKAELRAAHFNRELKNAKRSVPMGELGILMQVTLGIFFMFLIVISYSMLGISGPVFVSFLFLAALLTPLFYHAVKGVMNQRRTKANLIGSEKVSEAHQEA